MPTENRRIPRMEARIDDVESSIDGKGCPHWKRGLCSNRRLGRKMRERVRSSGASQRGGHMPGGRTFDPPSSAHEVPVARELRTRVDRPGPSGRNALLEEPGIVEGDL